MTQRFVAIVLIGLALAGCSGSAVVAPTSPPPTSGNPTVPPTAAGVPGDAPALGDLPTLPDAASVTPGDRFSMQTIAMAVAGVEAFYTEALAGLGLALAGREEDAAGIFGRGLLLTYTGAGVTVYVMAMPEFEQQLTGVLLTLDEAIIHPPANSP